MARLRLTVGKITVSTEKETGKLVLPVSLLNMSIYEMSLVNFSFKKKMYQPTEVLADLRICNSEKSNSIWKPLQRNQIEMLFKHKQVKLEAVRNDGDETDGELDPDKLEALNAKLRAASEGQSGFFKVTIE